MSPLRDTQGHVGARWEGRPLAALAVRGMISFGPFVLSTVFVWLAAEHLVPSGAALTTVVLSWIALSGIASGLLYGLDRLARRLMPLAALLDLSLIFPDEAPSRFKTAMGTLSTKALERELAKARSGRRASTPAEAAQRLLQFVAALGTHDRRTRGHSERVRAYSQIIASEMRLSRRNRDRLNWAALIHDVGKLTVPTEILNKPGKPTEEELDLIRRHAEEGARLVEPLREWLGDWCDAVADHHEKWDGTGYPKGLTGTRISLGGRIVAVADAFDVMTSARSYKSAQSVVKARKELVYCSGSHFDPSVVRAFLSMSAGRLRFAVGPLALLTHLPFVGRVPVAPAFGAGASSLGVAAATLVALPVAPVAALTSPLSSGGPREEATAVTHAAGSESLEDAVQKLGVTTITSEKTTAGGNGAVVEDPCVVGSLEGADPQQPEPAEDPGSAPEARIGSEKPDPAEPGSTQTSQEDEAVEGSGKKKGKKQNNGIGYGVGKDPHADTKNPGTKSPAKRSLAKKAKGDDTNSQAKKAPAGGEQSR
ncbi:MAG: HD-GYP domain-containing protein [Thermoleophilia bacterium]|nr:HD-GYP domain-containing protein [Thermoleophilia bacterium]